MTVFLLFYNTFLYRRYVNWKQIPLAMTAFIVTDLVAVRLLHYIGTAPFMYTLLGVLFMAMAIYMFWGQRQIHLQATAKNAIFFNGMSGILNGLFGAGGPFAATYFLAISKDKNEYIGTVQAVFAVTMLIDVLMRTAQGMFHGSLVVYGGISIWCMILGLWIGRLAFSRLNGQMVQKIIAVLMFLNGVHLIFR